MATLKELKVSKKDEFVLNIDDIYVDPTFNPRKPLSEDAADMIELRDRIMRTGVLRSIVIRMENGRPVLKDGHRRLFASKMAVDAGCKEAQFIPVTSVPKVLKDPANDLLIPIIYNEGSVPLTMLETALQVARIKESGVPIVEIAKKISKSRQHVYDLLLLHAQPENVKAKITNGELTASEVIKAAKMSKKEDSREVADVVPTEEVSRCQSVCHTENVPSATKCIVKGEILKANRWIYTVVNELDNMGNNYFPEDLTENDISELKDIELSARTVVSIVESILQQLSTGEN